MKLKLRDDAMERLEDLRILVESGDRMSECWVPDYFFEPDNRVTFGDLKVGQVFKDASDPDDDSVYIVQPGGASRLLTEAEYRSGAFDRVIPGTINDNGEFVVGGGVMSDKELTKRRNIISDVTEILQSSAKERHKLARVVEYVWKLQGENEQLRELVWEIWDDNAPSERNDTLLKQILDEKEQANDGEFVTDGRGGVKDETETER